MIFFCVMVIDMNTNWFQDLKVRLVGELGVRKHLSRVVSRVTTKCMFIIQRLLFLFTQRRFRNNSVL